MQICKSKNPDLIPTCEANGGKTWHDSILIKGRLLNFFVSGEVIRNNDFDTHNPFVTKFRVPSKTVAFKTWKVPKDWTTLKYDQWAFHKQYQKLSDTRPNDELDSETLIVNWASRVETAFDMSLQECHKLNPDEFPQPSLPKDFRGRCTGH